MGWAAAHETKLELVRRAALELRSDRLLLAVRLRRAV
jgi:hypothetical protein